MEWKKKRIIRMFLVIFPMTRTFDRGFGLMILLARISLDAEMSSFSLWDAPSPMYADITGVLM